MKFDVFSFFLCDLCASVRDIENKIYKEDELYV